MSTLSERLKEAMTETGISAADLSRATGAKEPSISKWVNGPTQNLKGKNLVIAAALLNVSEAWLAHGVGPKERRSSRWPFAALDENKVMALNHDDLIRIETAVLAFAERFSIDVAVDKKAESAA